MRKITSDVIEEAILNEYIPQKTVNRVKLIKQINEMYQYSPKYYKEVMKGDYNFIKTILASHNYEYS